MPIMKNHQWYLALVWLAIGVGHHGLIFAHEETADLNFELEVAAKINGEEMLSVPLRSECTTVVIESPPVDPVGVRSSNIEVHGNLSLHIETSGIVGSISFLLNVTLIGSPTAPPLVPFSLTADNGSGGSFQSGETYKLKVGEVLTAALHSTLTKVANSPKSETMMFGVRARYMLNGSMKATPQMMVPFIFSRPRTSGYIAARYYGIGPYTGWF